MVDAEVDGTYCQVCGRDDDGDTMLLCDKCYEGYHIFCLKPQLAEIPEGDWLCDECKGVGNNGGV